VFLLEEERVGHSADLINIDQLPFGGFAGQDPLVLFKPNLEFARSLEFDWFCGGHGNIGEKSDFDFYLSYLDEVASLVNEYVPRPASVPDLSLTDYLAGLDADATSRLLSELDNHFGLYLYGRQIVAGEQPARGSGNPFMSGAIGEWAAERVAAVDEAVPQIIERLRPKYGRMYNFDDGAAGQRPPPGHVHPAKSDQPVTVSSAGETAKAGPRTAFGNPPSRVGALRAEAVELAVLNATDERVPFVRREAENRACSVPAVPDANFAAGQARYLNAVTVRETQRAFHPFGLTFERRHSLAIPSLICVFALHTRLPTA